MATQFFIRTIKKEGTAKLYTRVRRPKLGINWLMSSDIKVDIAEWSKAQKNSKAMALYFSTEQGKKVQQKMQEFEDVINDMFDNGTLQTDADKSKLVEALSSIKNTEGRKALAEVQKAQEEEKRAKYEAQKSKMECIVNYYDYFLKGIQNGEIRKDKEGKMYRLATIRNWQHFGKYMKEYTPADMKFNQITKKFADGFIRFLEDKGFMPKSINKHVICFRALCNMAAIDEVNSNLVSVKVWQERSVKDSEKRAEVVLTDEEIDAIYNLQLSGVRDQVRDMWLLGYWSAQRVSDFAHFTRENFKETVHGIKVIVLQQQKTGSDVVVPILDSRVLDICAKYGYNFPTLSQQQINRYIKEVCKIASESVLSLRTLYRTQLSQDEREREERYLQMKAKVEQGEKLDAESAKRFRECEEYVKEHDSAPMLWKRDFAGEVVRCKFEMVSTHSARRSAVTSMYDSGLYDVRDMMSVSGHTTLSNFEKYIKRNDTMLQAERIAQKAQKGKAITMNIAK